MGYDGFGPAADRRASPRTADAEGLSGWLGRIDERLRGHDRRIITSRSAVTQGGVWRLDETQSGASDEFEVELSPGAGIWIVDLSVTCAVSDASATLNAGAFVGASWSDGASSFTAGPFPLRYTTASAGGAAIPLSIQVAESKTVTVTFQDVAFTGAATPVYDFDANAVGRRIR